MDEQGTETSQSPEKQPQAPHSTADYEDFKPPQKDRRRLMKIIKIAAIVFIAGAIILLFYILFTGKKPTGNNSSTTQSQAANQPSQTQLINTSTKTYASQNFALSFDHPSDWTVSDVSGSGSLSVKSPSIQLTDATGQKVNGQIILTLRAKTQKLSEFDAGSAVALTDSKKISYTKPTQSQRGETYLSYLRYAKTANAAGLDGVYITGNSGYKTGQDIPLADVTKVDPVVSITFAKCSDSACSNVSPLSIALSSWQDANFSGPLESILKSLSIS